MATKIKTFVQTVASANPTAAEVGALDKQANDFLAQQNVSGVVINRKPLNLVHFISSTTLVMSLIYDEFKSN